MSGCVAVTSGVSFVVVDFVVDFVFVFGFVVVVQISRPVGERARSSRRLCVPYGLQRICQPI